MRAPHGVDRSVWRRSVTFQALHLRAADSVLRGNSGVRDEWHLKFSHLPFSNRLRATWRGSVSHNSRLREQFYHRPGELFGEQSRTIQALGGALDELQVLLERQVDDRTRRGARLLRVSTAAMNLVRGWRNRALITGGGISRLLGKTDAPARRRERCILVLAPSTRLPQLWPTA
jgi:hypothetical protein